MNTRTKILIAIAIAGLMQITGSATADDKNVGQLWYANCGDYSVDPVWVNWKIDGEKHDKKIDRTLQSGSYTCVDLEDLGVPEGAEVWLSYQIVLGEKESCRKDETHFFHKPGSHAVEMMHSKGGTLTDNRCRLDRHTDPEGSTCETKGDAAKWWYGCESML